MADDTPHAKYVEAWGKHGRTLVRGVRRAARRRIARARIEADRDG